MTYSTKQFIIRQRYLMIQDHKEQMPIKHIALKYRTSRTTVYRWIWRYESEGKEGLLSRSNRPKSPHPNALSISKIRLIKRIRKRTKYGPRRIRLLMLKRGIKVSEYAIYKVLFRVIAVRTDNGTEFTNHPFHREHAFVKECARLGIRHILNRPAYPQGNGKCERSHRTDDEEFYRRYPAKDPREWQYRLSKWEYEYNYQRTHQGLGDITPYQAWINYEKEKERTKEKEKSLNYGVNKSVT